MKVVGIRTVSFTPKPDEKNPNPGPITGIKLFCTYPMNPKDGEGVGTDSFFLSDWVIQNRLYGEVPKVNDEISVSYNRYGKIDSVHILP